MLFLLTAEQVDNGVHTVLYLPGTQAQIILKCYIPILNKAFDNNISESAAIYVRKTGKYCNDKNVVTRQIKNV